MFDGQHITPFLALKGGYAIGNLKEKHHEELILSWSSGTYNDVKFRNHGGLMLHPEVGVSIPLDGKCDLLLTAAVRHQRIKQKVTKVYEVNQHDQWEHKEKLNLLTIGIAFLFR
jgi:outer membrane protein W